MLNHFRDLRVASPYFNCVFFRKFFHHDHKRTWRSPAAPGHGLQRHLLGRDATALKVGAGVNIFPKLAHYEAHGWEKCTVCMSPDRPRGLHACTAERTTRRTERRDAPRQPPARRRTDLESFLIDSCIWWIGGGLTTGMWTIRKRVPPSDVY